MTWAKENGYTPITFEALMDAIRLAINAQLDMNFSTETFVASNYYKYFYTLAQRVLENETKTADIFAKLQQYISTTNQKIQRPSVSLPGLLDSFASKGYVASVKNNLVIDKGTISIAVDVDDTLPSYPAKKLEIGQNIAEFVAAGLVTIGDETQQVTLTNGQQFDMKFQLPNRIPVKLRITLDPSDNQTVVVPSDEDIRIKVFANTNARYRLGWDFEPQRYFTQVDAPWAATILLEYSDNGGTTWDDDVFQANYDDLFTFGLDDITVVVNP